MKSRIALASTLLVSSASGFSGLPSPTFSIASSRSSTSTSTSISTSINSSTAAATHTRRQQRQRPTTAALQAQPGFGNHDAPPTRQRKSRVEAAVVFDLEQAQEQDLEQGGSSSSSRDSPTSHNQNRYSINKNLSESLSERLTERLTESLAPVLSASFLITGNTIGAGALVLPELASGPGMLPTTVMFGAAWCLNLVSGLVLAEVAIKQNEAVTTGATTASPSSFQEFVAHSLGSDMAATAVSTVALMVNACVLAFDFSRAGTVGAAVTGFDSAAFAGCWALGLLGLLATQSSQNLSKAASVLVTALFVTFGSLLLPGLAAVPGDALSVLAAPGTSPDCLSCMAHLAPIILMSMIYQNIVPSVTKLLDYDRAKTVAALTIGSAIPLVMYLSWIYAALGGGIDTSTFGVDAPLMTVFSFVTLAGSSLGSGMSLVEELDTSSSSNTPTRTERREAAFAIQPAVAAVVGPLAAALVFGGQQGGLTEALSIAGSFGSPILYGVVPALMAWNQRSKQDAPNLVPSASLPVLGLLSTGFVGQEMLSRVSEAFATI